MLNTDAVFLNDRFDLVTKEDCWSACGIDSVCNTVSWRSDITGCYLRRVAEDHDGTTDTLYESIRACEPGTDTPKAVQCTYVGTAMRLRLHSACSVSSHGVCGYSHELDVPCFLSVAGTEICNLMCPELLAMSSDYGLQAAGSKCLIPSLTDSLLTASVPILYHY